jgi:hypothetical protein
MGFAAKMEGASRAHDSIFEALYMKGVFENIKEVRQDRCYVNKRTLNQPCLYYT